MLTLPDAEFIYQPSFFNQQEQSVILERLKSEIAWRSDEITIFGKKVLQPRLVAWFGPQPYRYSGICLHPQTPTPTVTTILEKVNAALGIEFNCLLANYYRDGKDSMGWHADYDKELGEDPLIASLSFGARRLFKLRHKQEKDIKADIWLEGGSLLMMGKGSQKHYLHSLPKTSKPIAERVNLTFRKIVIFENALP